MNVWQGRHVVVVGASSGIGRLAAIELVRAGADVVLTARRADKLSEAVTEAGGGTAVTYDVSGDPAELVAAVGERPVDVVLFSAGTAALRPLLETDETDWQQILAVNTVGINRSIAALVPSLAPGAIVTVISSEAAGAPLWGLGAYAASKAALETTIKAWKHEQPGIRFSCLAVGATLPSDFGTHLDPARLGEAFGHWSSGGYSPQIMETADVAAALVGVLGSILPFPSVNLEYAMVRAPAPAGHVDLTAEAARNNLDAS